MGITVGIVGTGAFAEAFIPLFRAHPQVDGVVLCDLDGAKLAAAAARHGVRETLPSLNAVCESRVDAVALFTQHHLHGPQAIQALGSGKHVYSAVPSAISIEEMTALVQTVQETGLIYMLGETSYYYPCTLYCRERHRRGDFGHVVYAEAEYYHDMSHGLYDVYRARHGADWERYAGIPPLYYPTHSTSMVVSVTGAHVTEVCGMGFVDRHEDNLYLREDNVWANPYSNETMLCRLSDGSMARLNEFRRIGHPGTVGMSLYGTEASYEEQVGAQMWVTKDRQTCLNLTADLACVGRPADGVGHLGGAAGSPQGTFRGVSNVHPVDRLPAAYVGLPNGHCGSHQFLVDDFVRACADGSTPPNNVWDAARYLLPGLVAHQSALSGGALLPVPDLGDPPGAVTGG